ncbi:hypothetical protein EL22_16935 [Halostagnicola sp. A56]|uniref:anti-CBASS protein Acb1 family protein n=1 Tax=Halostagnicola sp. A56 TaxID=1495067 RepID=UPI0004A06D97|nr:anti-CBASS Acb1 family protein [Halostagnicola sp. A56]KDE59812.1 hypothetical protein EL22_16935 [Halostagnicola sp. A56]
MSDTTDDDLEETVAEDHDYKALEGLTAIEQLDEDTLELIAMQQVDMQMRQAMATNLGQNIAGADDDDLPDYYEIFDWDPNPSTADFYALALRNPYAFAVTFLPASTSWRDPPTIVDDAEPDSTTDSQTQFEKDIDRIVREHNLWDYTKRADKLAGIGDYGCLVLVFDDVQQSDVTDDDGNVDSQAFAQPADGAEQLVELRPFSRLSIEQVVLGGPTSGRWGKPVEYQIDLDDEDDEEFDTRTEDGMESDLLRVHHSRVIHIHSDELLDDQIRGIPRQQACYNNLIDIEKALGSAGELAYRASAWGINVNIDKDYQLDNDNALTEHLHRWQVGLENVLRTHGAADVQNLGGEEIDPSGVIDPNIEAISSQPYMPPQSVLKGNETGERATGEDLKNWYGEIQERRETFITPTIVRALIDRLIDLGIVAPPRRGPSKYSVEWDPLAELSEKNQAEVRNIRSEVLERVVGVGLTPEQRLEYLCDGSLPTELHDVADDIAALEDAEATAAAARDVDEMTAEYEAVTDGGISEDD